MKYFAAILFLVTFGIGCGSKSKSSGPLDSDPQRLKDFNEAMKDLSYENYASASSRFEALLSEKPVSELDLVILYNSGVALEGMGNCDKAATRYRTVSRVGLKRFEKISALALYRLGFAYSCMGDAKKSIIAFLDAKKKSAFLPPDVATAELPARLAAAYASIGRQKEALFYFNQASEGLKRILASAKRDESDVDLAAKTLYSMGKLGEVKQPLLFVRMLGMQQAFLLQATELRAERVSKRAKDELIGAYKNLTRFRFQNRSDQKEFYLEALRAARELQKLRLPAAKEYTQDLFLVVDKVVGWLEGQLAKMSDTLEKTPEQLKRESLKREGRIREE